ncbi:MAG: hypothetical protein M3124_05270 [Actinomycetota bacterium]|nr:hypothetical protein [Actinomycetota bacterium]
MDVRRWVLVTDGGHGGSRDCIAAVRALHASGYDSVVTVSEGTSRASASRYSKQRVHVPHVNEPGYVEGIEREFGRRSYLLVLPTSEASLLALGGPNLHLTDKSKLEAAAADAGIDVPRSDVFAGLDDVLAQADDLRYPVVVKPTIRTFSAVRVNSPAQLSALPVGGDGGEILVQEWVDDQLHAVSGVMWKGRLIAATFERWLRIWPVGCGLASAAVTTPPDPELEAKLVRLLGDYQGIFCAQFAGSRLIDLNLRIHSSHSLAVKAGTNLVAIYCDLLNGMAVPRTRGKAGCFYRWLEGDIRHLADGYRSKRMSLAAVGRALMPRRGAAHSIESLLDPAPLLTRLAYGAGRVGMSPEQRKQSPLTYR